MNAVRYKKELRGELISRRNSLSQDVRDHKNQRICTWLEDLLGQNTRNSSQTYVAVYAAMGSEVDLAQFIAFAYTHEYHVCFPCMSPTQEAGRTQQMVFREVSEQDWRNNSAIFLAHPIKTYALDDPALANCPLMKNNEINFVVVPLVGFAQDGTRLGYGGGNYDRFLPTLSSDTAIYACAFAEQCDERIPAEPHDIPVQVISA